MGDLKLPPWRCTRCGVKEACTSREELPRGWDWRLVSEGSARLPDRFEARCECCVERESRRRA